MPIKKWKPTLEMLKNSIPIIIIIIVVLFSQCKTPIYKELICYDEVSIKNIIDSIEISTNRWLILSLNPIERDYKNEVINNSTIFLIEYKDGNILTKEVKIVDRDDYPFKPISITFDKSSNTVYLLNLAFQKQRAIESYELKKHELHYKKRFRSDNFKDLISLIYMNEKLIGLNYNDVFFSNNDIIIRDIKSFYYRNFNIKKGLKIKNFNNNIFIIIPKEKKILLLNTDFKLLETYKFDFYPMDLNYFNQYYYILLNKNFINYINDNNISKEVIKKNTDSYIYKLSIDILKNHRSFNIKDEYFEKFKIPQNAYYNNIIYFSNMKENEIMLNRFYSNSKKCNIDKDFLK